MDDDLVQSAGRELALLPLDAPEHALAPDRLKQSLIGKSHTEKVAIFDNAAEILAERCQLLGTMSEFLRDLRREHLQGETLTNSTDAWEEVVKAAERTVAARNRQKETRDRLKRILSPDVIDAIFYRVRVTGESAYKDMGAWATLLQQEGHHDDVAHVHLRLSHAVFDRLHRKGAQKNQGTLARASDLTKLKNKNEIPWYTVEQIHARGYYLDGNNILHKDADLMQGRILGPVEPSTTSTIDSTAHHETLQPGVTNLPGQLEQSNPPFVGRLTRAAAAAAAAKQLTDRPHPDHGSRSGSTITTPPPLPVPIESTTTSDPVDAVNLATSDREVETEVEREEGEVREEVREDSTSPIPSSIPDQIGHDDDDGGAPVPVPVPVPDVVDDDDDDGSETVIEEEREDVEMIEEGDGEEEDDVAVDNRNKKKKKQQQQQQQEKKCGCPYKIPRTFTQSFKATKFNDKVKQAEIAVKWSRYTKLHGDLCYRHLREALAAVGFKTKKLNNTLGVERMQTYFDAVQDSTLSELKEKSTTYHWFRKQYRPWRESDQLGTLNYAPVLNQPIHLDHDQQLALRAELGIDSDRWERDGSINIMCFDWWKSLSFAAVGGDTTQFGTRGVAVGDRTLMGIFLDEFDMYRHHLRQVNGSPDLGWGRNQFFSLAQQAMRQDPLYWLLYCALRPDGHTSLVSYPYYVKNAQPGNSTFFRHIDLNIDDLAYKGRGANQIQGTLSLDDEIETECTDIIPGMHKHIQQWAQDLTDRGLSNKCFVQRIEAKHFTKEDEKKYQTKWTAVPCRAGEVRITVPHLPHGSMGPATVVRRTMLPWFVAVNADGTLEVIESGTFNDIAEAHRDLMPARNSPSGLPNRYGTVLFPFPAAVPLTGMGLISDSLVARVLPTNQALLHLKQLLLFNREYREQYLIEWRKTAVRTLVKLYISSVVPLEKAAFGVKSYYARQSGEVGDDDGIEIDPERGEEDEDREVYQVDDAHGWEGGAEGIVEETWLSSTSSAWEDDEGDDADDEEEEG